jgi:hypothetical protein
MPGWRAARGRVSGAYNGLDACALARAIVEFRVREREVHLVLESALARM